MDLKRISCFDPNISSNFERGFMQATEQQTTLTAEKGWKIINQLAEIAADVENQASYYSFQWDEGNQITDTLLVDVNNWISQLQALLPNGNAQEVLPVVLPNFTTSVSTSESETESLATSHSENEIDEGLLKDPTGDERGTDSSTYLGAVAEAVAQELQGNPTAGFENAEALAVAESDDSNEENAQSTESGGIIDQKLASIDKAIVHTEQIETQLSPRVEFNAGIEKISDSEIEEEEAEIEEEEAESWFQEELAEEEKALSHKDSGQAEIHAETPLQQDTEELLQESTAEDGTMKDEKEGASTVGEKTTVEIKNLTSGSQKYDISHDSHDESLQKTEEHSSAEKQFTYSDKLVLSRTHGDVSASDEPLIGEDLEYSKTLQEPQAVANENWRQDDDANENHEVLTPSEVELLASEALPGGALDEETDHEEDLVVELDLDSEENLVEEALSEQSENPETSENRGEFDNNLDSLKNTNQTDNDGSQPLVIDHPEFSKTETTVTDNEIADSEKPEHEINSDTTIDESPETDELQEISVEDDEVENEIEEIRSTEESANQTKELIGEIPNAEVVDSLGFEMLKAVDLGALDGTLVKDENHEDIGSKDELRFFSDETKEVLIPDTISEENVSPETGDLRELESLEVSDTPLAVLDPTLVASNEESNDLTDLQEKQSAANLEFLQERYNRIAEVALAKGKLELAKDCYDSLAKILRLMK
jgi:hypothetical protein